MVEGNLSLSLKAKAVQLLFAVSKKCGSVGSHFKKTQTTKDEKEIEKNTEKPILESASVNENSENSQDLNGGKANGENVVQPSMINTNVPSKLVVMNSFVEIERMRNKRRIMMTMKPRGIMNVKYQCFTNVCMQSLLSCFSFLKRINYKSTSKLNVSKNLYKFCMDYCYTSDSIYATQLMDAMGLLSTAQDDPCEVLILRGTIGYLYKTVICTNLLCMYCSKVTSSEVKSDSTVILATADGKLNLRTSLQKQFGPPSPIATYCQRCQQQDGELVETIMLQHPLPEIMIFNFTLYSDNMERITGPIDVPNKIDMSPFVNENVGDNAIYVLRSTVYHIESDEGFEKSHYVTISKRGNESYLCNDNMVERVEEKALDDTGALAYLAFYERLDKV